MTTTKVDHRLDRDAPAEPVDWYCLRCKKTFHALMHVCPDCKGSDTRLASEPQAAPPELKACPFCGNNKLMRGRVGDTDSFAVRCGRCNAYTASSTLDQAIQIWNTRTSTADASPERIAEIRSRQSDGYETASDGNVAQAALQMLSDIRYLLAQIDGYKTRALEFEKAACEAIDAVVPTASALAEALRAAQATIESMRNENRLHGHITDASAFYLHKSKPLIDTALARWEKGESK